MIVFSEGAFDPAVMTGATPVEVNGVPGLLANVALANPGTARVTGIGTPPRRVPTVAWQYAKGRWAVAAWRNDYDAHARDLAVALARATRIGGSHRVLVPFAVGYLPAVVDRRVKLTEGSRGPERRRLRHCGVDRRPIRPGA